MTQLSRQLERDRALLSTSFEGLISNIQDLRLEVVRLDKNRPHAPIEWTGDLSGSVLEALAVLRAAGDAVPGNRSNTVTKSNVGQNAQSVMSAMLACLIDLTRAVRTSQDYGDAAQNNAADARLAPRLQRPLSKFTAVVQAADGIDQRLSHCIEALGFAVQNQAIGCGAATRVISAQVDAVGQTVGEIADCVKETAAAVAVTFQKFAAAGSDSEASVGKLTDISTRLRGHLSDFYALAAVDDLAASMIDQPEVSRLRKTLAIVGASERSHLLEEGSIGPRLGEVECLVVEMADLGDAFHDHAVALAATGVSNEVSMDDQRLLSYLERTYTSDVERAIHIAATGSRGFGPAVSPMRSFSIDQFSNDF
ncbi:MAG: hypothetical protein AAF439_08930 [Pseudomonadota bacterium]